MAEFGSENKFFHPATLAMVGVTELGIPNAISLCRLSQLLTRPYRRGSLTFETSTGGRT